MRDRRGPDRARNLHAVAVNLCALVEEHLHGALAIYIEQKLVADRIDVYGWRHRKWYCLSRRAAEAGRRLDPLASSTARGPESPPGSALAGGSSGVEDGAAAGDELFAVGCASTRGSATAADSFARPSTAQSRQNSGETHAYGQANAMDRIIFPAYTFPLSWMASARVLVVCRALHSESNTRERAHLNTRETIRPEFFAPCNTVKRAQ